MSVLNTYKSIDSFVKIEKAFKPYLEESEKLLINFASDKPIWFQNVLNHLLLAGGKRIRPIIVFLSYSLLTNENINSNCILMSAIAEYVHTATLLHDDVIDEGKERRGLPTVNLVYGNHTAVLGGDFILSKVFRELRNFKNELFEMINTVSKLVEGEIHQMDMKNKDSINLEDYEKLIYLKTASLFEWCTVAGTYSCNKLEYTELFRNLGNHIGRIFQIVDDILDYTGNNILGKKRLQDFYQGKITLPLIFLFQEDNYSFVQWKTLVKNNDLEKLEKLGKDFSNRIKEEDIQIKMKNYLEKDIISIKNVVSQIPKTKYHDYVNDLISFLVSRIY
ncbi:MAG: octaprenyl-diphosphate synthase [Candidatus Sericytochromatia bacterium]|nr:MAG: octaprenyl-diphosphate synthase [Candidatus Sericytochromatia bacterium]